MRSRVVLPALGVMVAAGIATAVSLAASSTASRRLPLRLVPTAMAFRDSSHGVLATGWAYDSRNDGGTIELTSDGGRTWHTVMKTPRRVVSVTFSDPAYGLGMGVG